MATVIGILQVKGGVGRSTLATNLAGELAKRGKQTALVDADMPQGTAASWYVVRKEAGLVAHLDLSMAQNHRELVAAITTHDKADYIVIDAPPRLAESSRVIAAAADLLLIPVGPTYAEVWATSDLKPILQAAGSLRPVTARLLWTRHRPHVALAQEVTQTAEKTLGLKALRATLGFRVAYQEALGNGRTVTEMGDPVAREEFDAVVTEALRLMR